MMRKSPSNYKIDTSLNPSESWVCKAHQKRNSKEGQARFRRCEACRRAHTHKAQEEGGLLAMRGRSNPLQRSQGAGPQAGVSSGRTRAARRPFPGASPRVREEDGPELLQIRAERGFLPGRPEGAPLQPAARPARSAPEPSRGGGGGAEARGSGARGPDRPPPLPLPTKGARRPSEEELVGGGPEPEPEGEPAGAAPAREAGEGSWPRRARGWASGRASGHWGGQPQGTRPAEKWRPRQPAAPPSRTPGSEGAPP